MITKATGKKGDISLCLSAASPSCLLFSVGKAGQDDENMSFKRIVSTQVKLH